MPWVRAHYRPSRRRATSSGSGVFFLVLIFLALAVLGAILKVVVAGVTFAREHIVAVLLIGFVVAAAPLALAVTRRRRRQALERLEARVRSLCAAPNLDESAAAVTESEIRKLSPLPTELADVLEALYRGEIASALDDRHLDSKERSRLDALSRTFGLASSTIQQAELEAFLQVYTHAVADDRLTGAEEQTLAALQSALRIPPESIQRQTEKLRKLGRERETLLAELAAAREVTRAPLNPIQCSIVLKRGENCYLSSSFHEKKMRVVSSQQIAGMRFAEKNLVDDRAGDLYITNKRLLLVAGGTTSIVLDKIIDIKVDDDSRILSIVVDGRKSAYYFAVPQPFVLAAFLHRARDGL
jgi:hypothetical protein